MTTKTQCNGCGIVIGGRFKLDFLKQMRSHIEQEPVDFGSFTLCSSCYFLLQERGWLCSEHRWNMYLIIFSDGSSFPIHHDKFDDLKKGVPWQQLKLRVEGLARSRV